MKTSIILASAAFAGFAVAQLQELPVCAQSCANDILGGGVGDCDTSDIECVCGNESFIDEIACCLAQPGGCDEADQSSAVDFASQLCQANGVTVPSAVVCPTGASGSGSAATADPTETDADEEEAEGSEDAAWRPRETGLAAVVGGLVAVALL